MAAAFARDFGLDSSLHKLREEYGELELRVSGTPVRSEKCNF